MKNKALFRKYDDTVYNSVYIKVWLHLQPVNTMPICKYDVMEKNANWNLFTGNALAPTTNDYCDFNANPKYSVMDKIVICNVRN